MMARRGHELGVAVTLDDLVADRVRGQPQLGAGELLDFRRHGGEGADSAGDHADGDALGGIGQAQAVALHFFHPQRQLQAEGDRLGVDTVGAAGHDGVLVLHGALAQGGDEFLDIVGQDSGSLDKLQARGGVHDIG